MVARSLGNLVLVSELHILQLYPTAWILRAAIKIHSNLGCRCSMNVLVRNITDFDSRGLLILARKKKKKSAHFKLDAKEVMILYLF